MAYITQEQKKEIAAILKTKAPKGWKFSLSIKDHAKLVCTIQSAPVDIMTFLNSKNTYKEIHHKFNINEIPNSEVKSVLLDFWAALNLNNYNNSDSMTDYFDVGHYVCLQVGKWDKPFKVAA